MRGSISLIVIVLTILTVNAEEGVPYRGSDGEYGHIFCQQGDLVRYQDGLYISQLAADGTFFHGEGLQDSWYTKGTKAPVLTGGKDRYPTYSMMKHFYFVERPNPDVAWNYLVKSNTRDVGEAMISLTIKEQNYYLKVTDKFREVKKGDQVYKLLELSLDTQEGELFYFEGGSK